MNIKGNGPSTKRMFDKIRKRKEVCVINAEERTDSSANESTSHEKEYKQYHKMQGKRQGSNADK